MKLVAISDTHGQRGALALPPGDVLVHAGDFCRRGTWAEVDDFLGWFEAQPHAAKVLVAGNHDLAAEKEPERLRRRVPPSVLYLEDAGATVDGFRFWGAPWTPVFYDWSFMLPRGELLRARWDLIPAGIDVLVTHGPPYGHGDLAPPHLSAHPKAVGCLELLAAVRRVRPQVHVFGHIHAGHGITLSDEVPHVRFVNAATCTEAYAPTNPALVVEVRPDLRRGPPAPPA